MKKITGFILLLVCFVFLSDALAHKVLIYAWVDGDLVHTESKFGSGRKAQNSTVSVFGPEGSLLLSGKTDTLGEFKFSVPGPAPLKIVIEAGPGHRGEWTIAADELPNKTKLNDNTEAVHVQGTQISSQNQTYKAAVKDEIPNGRSLTIEDLTAIRKIVDEGVDEKLSPIKRYIAASNGSDPTIQDIIGGLGYIFGLVGLGAYMASRKKR